MRDGESRSVGLIDLDGLSLKTLENVHEVYLRRILEPLLQDDTEPMAGFQSRI